MKKRLLKVLVGSQAHGLAGKDSDSDYRGVFIVPTSELLAIGVNVKNTHWIEGKTDDTSWEIGKFLLMATKCNPTVLETFLAPQIVLDTAMEPDAARMNMLSTELRSLFLHVWNSADVKNAFIGYGLNQRKKFFKNQDNRAPKYAVAYLRVLYNAWELLSSNDKFSVDMTNTPVFKYLKKFRKGDYEIGEVIQQCFEWETNVLKAFRKNPNKKTNIKPLNEFLLKVRREIW